MSRDTYDGKYKALTDYLESEADGLESMTFDQIERLLGFALPKSAENHQAWWANQSRGQSLAWLRAGFRSSAVSVDERRLTFVRLERSKESEHRGAGDESISQPITIVEAKERLAQTFGVEPSQIEIIIRA